MTTHSSILAWEIPWTEGCKRVRHDLQLKTSQLQITALTEKSQGKGRMGTPPCRTQLGGKLLDLKSLLLGLLCLKLQDLKEDLMES